MTTGNITNYSTKDIQSKLGITSDGIYGNQTTNAVKQFQQQNGLTADGIFGQNTLKAFQSKYGGGSSASGVEPSTTAGNLGTQPFVVPPAPTTQSLATELGTQISGYQNNVDTLENNQNQGMTDVQTLQNMLTGQTADTQKAENDAGLPQLSADLRDLQALSQQQTARYIQGYTQAENQVIPLGVIRNQQQEATRQHGIDAMITNANISAKQGNIETAQSMVDRAVALKYDPIKQQLQNKLDFLKMNADNLSRADKKLADAKSTQLDLQLKQIEKREADEKEVLNMRTLAISQGAPKALVDAAIGKSPVEASKILGKYAGDYLKYNLLKEQISTEKAQRANINANIAKTKTETAMLGSGGQSGVSPVTGKPYTVDQITNSGFADRVSQANTIIDSLSGTFAKMNYAQFKLAESKSIIANTLLTAEQRQAAQAMRNFITAKLRKESGASISPSEFADARLQYFPSLKDDPQTLTNKKALRDSVLNNLVMGSGGGFTPPNPFAQAINANTTPISGSSIISGVSSNGTLNFNLPK